MSRPLPPKPKININDFIDRDGSIRPMKRAEPAPPPLPQRPRPDVRPELPSRNGLAVSPAPRDSCKRNTLGASPVKSHHSSPSLESDGMSPSPQQSESPERGQASHISPPRTPNNRVTEVPPRNSSNESLQDRYGSPEWTQTPGVASSVASPAPVANQQISTQARAAGVENLYSPQRSNSSSTIGTVSSVASQSSLLAQTRHAQHEIPLKIHEADHHSPPAVPVQFLTSKFRALLGANDRYVCVTTGYKVLLYSWRSAKLMWELKINASCAVIVSRTNTVWLGTSTGSIVVVGINTGVKDQILERGHVKPVTFLSVSYEERVISLSAEDGKVNRWSTTLRSDGRDSDIFPEQTYRITGKCPLVDYSDDMMWTARDVQLDAYSLRGGGAVRLVSTALKKRGVSLGTITSLATRRGMAFFGQNDGFITVFDGPTCLGSINGGIHTISALVAPSSTELWAGTRSGDILVFQLLMSHDSTENLELSASLRRQWKAHKTAVTRLLSAEQKAVVLTVDRSGDVKAWNSTPSSVIPPVPSFSQAFSTQILTWNVDACTPESIDPEWIVSPIRGAPKPADIVVIGLQEVIELEKKSQAALKMIKSGDAEIAGEYEQWRSYLENLLAPLGLCFITSKPLVGIMSCLFVRRALVSHVSNVEARVVKTGMGGAYGNKGGVIITLRLGSMSFSFINCHLAAGHTSIIQRNKDADQIILSSSHLDYDSCFFFGDTNYRINAVREQAEGLIKNRNWDRLRQQDQLISQITKNPSFSLGKFQEGLIEFAPTYKFDRGTNRYDTSDKKRIPSWCDRILFRGKAIVVDEYRSLDTRTSDHKAVFGSFVIPVLRKEG